MWSQLALVAGLGGLAVAQDTQRPKRVKTIALFGDSFTDQSRAHAIGNGTWPGKNYQQVYPPYDHGTYTKFFHLPCWTLNRFQLSAATGGYQWPFYLGAYGNYSIHNYAVGGSVCSNALTPVTTLRTDVSGGQKDWFVEDHIVNGRLQLDPDEFVTVLWIGTNDVGE